MSPGNVRSVFARKTHYYVESEFPGFHNGMWSVGILQQVERPLVPQSGP